MRREIAILAAATTSAIILSFIVPLGLLVQTMARDRALAAEDQEARNVAILVSGLSNDRRLATLVKEVDDHGPAVTTALLPDGQMLGTPVPGLQKDPEVIRAQTGEAFTVVDSQGARIYIPVVAPGGNAVVRASMPPQQLDIGVKQAWLIIGLLGVAMFAVALWAALVVARRISRPVTDLAGVAHRLREGELTARAEPDGPAETLELGEALNRLADRITELLEAERATVGDLSHRLRTPVTALRLDVEAVEQPEVAERLHEHIVTLQRSIDAIVREARRPVLTSMPAECDLAAVARERVEFWTPLAEDQDRPFTADVTTEVVPVGLTDSDAQDLLDVLIDNVFAHTPEGTPFALSLTTDLGNVFLVVSDNGPGFSHEPSGPRRVGTTGLGLDIVERTVTGLGGEAGITAPPGGGTTVRIRLPRRG
jgi:signal transduction histidine kinase